MWPSLELATKLYNLANLALIVGLVVGAVATVIIVWSGNVKEEYLNRDLAKSRERTAILEDKAEAARASIAAANENAAKANERAAVAEKDAAEARLQLEKLKTPRLLTEEQGKRIVESLRKFSGVPFDFLIQAEQEPINLMKQIGTLLRAAGWDWRPFKNPGASVYRISGMPDLGLIAFTGIEIHVHHSTPEWHAAVAALCDALNAEGIEAKAQNITDDTIAPDAIHINIGAKPH